MKILKIAPDSEAERRFINKYMPVCKDKVICRLGVIFGWPYNEYEITDEDFLRCKKKAQK